MPSLQRTSRTLVFLLLGLLAGTSAWAAPAPPNAAPPDPLEASLVGEFALQAGQLPEAAQRYFDAARAAQDPVLAERATRIAYLAGADALAGSALELWQSLVPRDLPAMHAMAASLALRAGQRRRARAELAQLLAVDDGWKLAIGALSGAVGKQPRLVVNTLTNIVNRDQLPKQLEAWLAVGGLAQRLEQPKLVDRIITKVVERFPGEPRVVLLRAQLLRQDGKLAQARDQLAAVEDPARLLPELRWALAGEYAALGDPGKAAKVLAQGAQDDSSYAQRAAWLNQAKDNTALAAMYAELARGASKPNPVRRMLLGQVAEYLEKYDAALSWYANVPGTQLQGLARLRSAFVLHAMKKPAAAYAALRALQGDSTLEGDARRDGYLAEAELRLKDKDAAGEQDALTRGLAAFADDQALLYTRALMWERRDQIDKAEADFRRILLIDPNDVDTLNALGYTLADRTTRYREALPLIERARVAAPGNAAIIDSYGWVLFRLGKTRAALEQLQHAFALQQDADIASHLGQVLWVLGRRDEAHRYFEEAKRLDPESRALQRALHEIGQ